MLFAPPLWRCCPTTCSARSLARRHAADRDRCDRQGARPQHLRALLTPRRTRPGWKFQPESPEIKAPGRRHPDRVLLQDDESVGPHGDRDRDLQRHASRSRARPIRQDPVLLLHRASSLKPGESFEAPVVFYTTPETPEIAKSSTASRRLILVLYVFRRLQAARQPVAQDQAGNAKVTRRIRKL